MNTVSNIQKIKPGLGVLRYFRYTMIFIFFIIPILYAASLAIEAGSLQPGLNYLGPKLLAPTISLYEQSSKIIEDEGVYRQSEYLFLGFWDSIKVYWNIIGSIYLIGMWIYVLSFLYGRSFFSNTSESFSNIAAATIGFLLIQMFYLVAVGDPELSMWLPFTAFYEFLQAIPYLLSEISSSIDATEVISNGINQTENVSY